MTITSVNTTTATPTTTTSTSSTSEAGAALTSDFETFLNMLTAQARYQDPLEPLDSTAFSSQLAQFSMVEQQVQSNDLLTALAGQMGTGNMAQMAAWVGMEARTSAAVPFDGSAITIHPNPLAASDEVFLVAYNDEGREVQRMEIPVSSDPVIWDGVADDGSAFPDGSYRFEIENYADEQLLVVDPADTYARVTEARLQEGQTVLIVEGGAQVLADTVSGLREPS